MYHATTSEQRIKREIIIRIELLFMVLWGCVFSMTVLSMFMQCFAANDEFQKLEVITE